MSQISIFTVKPRVKQKYCGCNLKPFRKTIIKLISPYCSINCSMICWQHSFKNIHVSAREKHRRR